jgi:hypothetical protein
MAHIELRIPPVSGSASDVQWVMPGRADGLKHIHIPFTVAPFALHI